MTKFWHRRISEAAMFVAAILLILYFVPLVLPTGLVSRSLPIPQLGAIFAGITLAVSFISYLYVPKKNIGYVSLAVYFLLAATAGSLIVSTGGPFSVFISLWLVIAVFASVFGWYGILPLLAAGIGYEVYLTIVQAGTPFEGLLIVSVVSVVPLVVSYIVFHAQGNTHSKEDKTYHALTAELNEVSNKSDTVIGAIDDGVIAINSKGIIELMNPAAQRIIGWGKSDALGLDYHSVLKLTDKSDQPVTDAADPILQVLNTNQDTHTKALSLTTSSGKKVILSLTVSPIGQVGQGAIIVFNDITKEASEEREQAEFISTASHEMRTPVASIEGYLGLALNPNTAQIDDKARDYITKAHQSAQHLGRLFQDLLDVSKAEDGRLSNHPAVVDVIDYVGDIVEGLKPKADEKKLRLYYKPRPDSDNKIEDRTLSPVFYTNVDNDHLREVVANLVENAIKYTPSGDVIVDVTGDDDHVLVSIKDSGIGIPLEDIPHLFQKFYRVDNTATREIGGTGLGLYLCRRLAEVMGGRIDLESEFQKGSTFTLELPRLGREEAMRLIDAASSKIVAQNERLQPEASIAESKNDFLETPQQVVQPAAQPTIQLAPQPASQPPLQYPQPVYAQSPQVVVPPIQSQPPVQQAVATPQSQPIQQPQSAPTLAAIEQNPSLYAAPRPDQTVQIPQRPTNGQNQPPNV